MAGLPESETVRVLIDADVVRARRLARDLTFSLALRAGQRQAFVAAIGEVAREILHHVGAEEVRFELIKGQDKEGMRVVVVTEPNGDPTKAAAGIVAAREAIDEAARWADQVDVMHRPDGTVRVELVKWEDPQRRRLRERTVDLV